MLDASIQNAAKETALPKNSVILEEPMQSLNSCLTWHEATISCCLSNRNEEKSQCNLTALHKEPLCLDISFLSACTFVWCAASCCRDPGGAAPARTMWESEEANGTCYLFSTVSPKKRKAASLQSISCSNKIHQSRQRTAFNNLTSDSAQMKRVDVEKLQNRDVNSARHYFWLLL